jgi:hypothetical protein
LILWQTEKLSYRGQGSYRFSDEQRKSYALILDVEVISFVKEPYLNLSWRPAKSYWGNYNTFHGTTVAVSGQMNFAKQRLISTKNAALIDYLRDKQNFENEARLVTNWGELLEFAFEQVVPFESLPLLRHDETVLKFVANPLTQFQFQCYWLRALDNPDDLPEFDDSDPSKDDDEYPNPERRDPSDPFNPSKPVSPPNPDSDGRDFDPDFMANVPELNGTLSYQAYSWDQSRWLDRTKSVRSPGGLVGIPGITGLDRIDWSNSEDGPVSLTNSTSDSVMVRNAVFTGDNGEVRIPTPDFMDIASF